MLNQEMRTVTMSRSDMLRVQSALTHVVCDFRRATNDPEATDDAREIAKRSLAMWERIRSEFTAQLDAQDPEEFHRK